MIPAQTYVLIIGENCVLSDWRAQTSSMIRKNGQLKTDNGQLANGRLSVVDLHWLHSRRHSPFYERLLLAVHNRLAGGDELAGLRLDRDLVKPCTVALAQFLGLGGQARSGLSGR